MKALRLGLKFSVLTFFIMGLLQCTVREATPPIEAEGYINQRLVKEVEAISDPKAQKSAFAQWLTDEEKVFIFKKRITTKIQLLSLTTEQKNHLNLLLANMDPALYTRSQKGRKSQNFITEWTKQGREIFHETVLFDIVASLSPNTAVGKPTDRTAAPSTSNCGCATSSDWCSDGYACTYIPSCNGEGCGTFFAYTCNGHCDRVI